MLDKIRSSYLWDFSQQPPINQVLYAVYSDVVTVRYNIVYSSNMNANPVKLHTWNGPAVTHTPGAYAFYQDSSDMRYVNYTVAKGEYVPKPADPSPHSDKPSWVFIRWLIYNSTTDKYRYNAQNNSESYQSVLNNNGFDFTHRVTDDVTLVTCWTGRQQQTFTFTVENRVEGGSSTDEFDYNIEIQDVQVWGKWKDNILRYGEPNSTWGSVSTTLKNNQQYKVTITVTRKPYTTTTPTRNDEYSVWITVTDINGLVIKEDYLQQCLKQQVYDYVSDYKYTLKISQSQKSGYTSTVSVENEVPENNITYTTDNPTLSYTFAVEQATRRPENFTSNDNAFEPDENNSLTVVFTNKGASLITPTGVASSVMPYALMLTTGLLLAPFVLDKKRRKKEENE